MSDDRTIERSARAWLELGPTQAPDHAVDAALRTIDVTPQERDLRIPWRFPRMTLQTRLAAAAVVGVFAIGGAFLLLGRDTSQVGGPNPTPSLSIPTTTPTKAAVIDYTTIPGWIVFEFAGKAAPDGSTPAGVDDHHSLWLTHADGSGLHELAPGVPASGKVSFDISPDGSHVIFSAYDPPVQVWEIGIEGGAQKLLSTDCNGVPAKCMDSAPAYSPDGKRIAFVRGTETSSVVAIRDLASGGVTILDPTRSSSSDVWLDEPSWSPDGRQIVYEKVIHDPVQDKVTDTRIFTVNADGTAPHELALPAETPWGDPDWSPDGTRIVFGAYPIRYMGSGKSEVYSARPDGTDLQQLGHLGVGSGGPSWTSDGAHIIYWGYQSFYLMDPDGGNARPINRAALTFNVDGYGFYAQLQPTR
jgi:dipeptidyl aminopeptidase/acylaminoacyl peptidase